MFKQLVYLLTLLLCLINSLVFSPPSLTKSDWVEDDNSSFITPSPQAKSSPQNVGSALQGHVSQQGLSTNAEMSQSEGMGPFKILPRPLPIKISQGDLRKWLFKTNPDFLVQLSKIPKEQIIQVKGSWDDSDHILHGFGIPHTRVNANAITAKLLALAHVLVIDCGSMPPFEKRPLIRSFVQNGGYLLTTDWALDSCLRTCFPGYVAGNGGFTNKAVVDAQLVSNDPTFTRGTISSAFWQLEDKSQLVQVQSPAVRIIARSLQLTPSDPSQLGILALTFNFGRGKILHLVGHFDNNLGQTFNNTLADPSPQIKVSLRQAIAVNFLVSAFKQSNLSREDVDNRNDDK